jgi:hypothetical protein
MSKFTKAMTAAAMVAALTASHAMAADGTLAPGKPAGVQSAQAKGTSLLLIGGAAIVTVVAIVVASQQGNDAVCGAACNAPTTAT